MDSTAPGSQPFSDLVHIVDCPGGQRDHQVKPGVLTGLHPLAIEAKQHLAGGPRQPLVAIDESMVAAQGMQECCSTLALERAGLALGVRVRQQPIAKKLGDDSRQLPLRQSTELTLASQIGFKFRLVLGVQLHLVADLAL